MSLLGIILLTIGMPRIGVMSFPGLVIILSIILVPPVFLRLTFSGYVTCAFMERAFVIALGLLILVLRFWVIGPLPNVYLSVELRNKGYYKTARAW
jgi:hypothetical protein